MVEAVMQIERNVCAVDNLTESAKISCLKSVLCSVQLLQQWNNMSEIIRLPSLPSSAESDSFFTLRDASAGPEMQI